MLAKSLQFAALWAAVVAVSQTALGQYGPPQGPQGYGPPGAFQGAPVGYGQPGPMPPGQPMGPMDQPPMEMPMDGSMGGMGGGMDMGGAACYSGDSYQGWAHRCNVFGEFLYLRARNAEIAYAVEIDGPIAAGAPGVQAGRVGVVDPDFSAGFRFGGGVTIDETSALQLTYSEFDETTANAMTADAPNVIRSLVLQPSTVNAAANFLDASAVNTLQFKLVDADYRGLLAYNNDYKVSYLIGARYAKLDQDFEANFSLPAVETVTSSVNFDGGGLRFGLEAERYGRNNQLFVYGKTYASLIGGEFRASYLQGTQADPDIAFTTFRAGRLVSIYDLEVGGGWSNYCGNFRVSAGYMFSVWCNTVKNNELINAVQNNNFVDQSDNFRGMLSFDGFVARGEFFW